jgi:prepilin-type N-terminal cleavage/methylation domain-containing protein
MKINKLNNKKGFTLIELASVLSVMAILIVAVSVGTGLRDTGKVTSAAGSVRAIRNAAVSWTAAGNLSYTGIDVATLKTGGYLPAGFNATGKNSFGGDYSVAVNSGNNARFDVGLTNVSDSASTKLSSLLSTQAENTSYDPDSDIWTATF